MTENKPNDGISLETKIIAIGVANAILAPLVSPGGGLFAAEDDTP